MLAVLFDLDGTLYKGKTAITGAEETLEKLRKDNERILFKKNSEKRRRTEVV